MDPRLHLAVDVLDLHLLPEQVTSFQNSRYLAFSFLLLVKKPFSPLWNFASETS